MGDFQDAYKITAADRVDKGVTGLPDTPGLSTGDMQQRFDSLGNLAIDKFNALVDGVSDTVINDSTKLPTMKAIVDYVVAMGGGDMLKSVYDTDDDGVVDNSEALNGHNAVYFRNQYALTCPDTGYSEETVTIWGESKTMQVITLTSDKDGNPLTNFASGMIADYPINLSGTLDDFKKLYAIEIGSASVTLYFEEAPTAAFNVLIKEAI